MLYDGDVLFSGCDVRYCFEGRVGGVFTSLFILRTSNRYETKQLMINTINNRPNPLLVRQPCSFTRAATLISVLEALLEQDPICP